MRSQVGRRRRRRTRTRRRRIRRRETAGNVKVEAPEGIISRQDAEREELHRVAEGWPTLAALKLELIRN